jgi:hypothetical protein
MPVPPDVTMRRSMWGIRRATQSEKGARIVKTLLDTPFYARSVKQRPRREYRPGGAIPGSRPPAVGGSAH